MPWRAFSQPNGHAPRKSKRTADPVAARRQEAANSTPYPAKAADPALSC